MLINFFDSRGVVHKEFVPEGKTVNAEFYRREMDRLLKCIQRVRPDAFCSRYFFVLHDNAAAHKPASVCQFLIKNCYNSSSPRVLSRFISARLFSVPQVEYEVCWWCWDPRSRNWWIEEGPKRGIFGSFSEIVRPRKSLCVCQWSLFWIKKGTCLPHVSSIFLKISPTTFGPHCIYIIWPLKGISFCFIIL